MRIEDRIKEIVYYGTLAPSPFNIQAWKLCYDSNRLEIYIDRTLLDFGCLTDSNFKEHYISIGALIENLSIAAKEFNFETNITLFPEGENSDLVAVISFAYKSQVEKDELFKEIEKRWTNRNACLAKTVPDDVIKSLSNEAAEYGDEFQLSMTADINNLRRIARLAYLGEVTKWENESAQKKTYRWLRFSKGPLVDGIPVWSFGLPKGIAPLLKIVLLWPNVRVLNFFGFSRFIGYFSRWKKAVKAPNMFILTARADNAKNWVQGGRIFERMVLRATGQGLTTYYFNCIEELADVYILGLADRLSKKHKERMKWLYEETHRCFSLQGRPAILMVFSMGYADGEQPCPVIRKTVEDILTIK